MQTHFYRTATIAISTNERTSDQCVLFVFQGKITTNATASVRARAVGFLAQDDPSITTQNVIATLSDAFERHYEVICSILKFVRKAAN